MARIFQKPDYLTTTLGAKLTIAAGVDMTYCSLHFANQDTAVHEIEVNMVVTGDSAQGSNRVVQIELAAKEVWQVSFPGLMLPAAGAIHAKADANSAVTMMISGLTEVNA